MEIEVNKKLFWEVRDGIGYLKFIDPPQNSMNAIFFKELQSLTTMVIPESNVCAIIISGSGRHFSSGADLNDLVKLIREKKKTDHSKTLLSNSQSFQFFSKLNIPVIAAIKGVCIGSALELALHCHFRFCSEDAILGLPESTFGLMPGVGGIPKMMELTGKAKTIELVLKGNTFDAKTALDRHIVDAVYPKKMLTEKAIELAKSAMKNYRKYNKKDYLQIINNRDFNPDQLMNHC